MDQIVIDSNERDTVKKALHAIGVPTVNEPIIVDGKPCGDYTNKERGWLAERKSALDYRESLKSGHIYVQLAKMMQFDGPKYLIFEGDLDMLVETTKSKGLKALMRSFPLGLAHIYGVHWIHCYDPTETADTLVLINKYYKGVKDPGVHFEPIYLEKTVDERVRNLLTLPSIGQGMAETLLKKYKSIIKIIETAHNRPKELMTIPKFGPKKVEYINQMYYGEKIFQKPKRGKKSNKTPEQIKAKRRSEFARQHAMYNKNRKKSRKDR